MGPPDPVILNGDQDDRDAVLVAAERECQGLLAWADVQLEADPAEVEPILAEIGKRAATIYNTPPSTLVGAAVKLRLALHPELGIEEREDSETVTALRQVLALIEREIGQAGLPIISHHPRDLGSPVR